MMKTLIYTILFLNISTYVLGQSITLDPQSTASAGIQVNSDVALKKLKRETTNGGWTNYPRDNSSLLIFEGGGTLSGISDGQDGILLYVFNGYPSGASAAGQLTFQHESLSSNAVNRILTPTGTDFEVGNGGVALIYDGIKQRWRVATPEPSTNNSTTTNWGLSGNAGTTTSNFIGTTDAQNLTFKTNNVSRLTIDNVGDVGIGTTSPTNRFHVMKGSSGVGTSAPYTVARFESNTITNLNLLTPSNGIGTISFGSPTGNQRGWVSYDHLFDRIRIGTLEADRMVIDKNGNIGVGVASVNSNIRFHLASGSSGVTPNTSSTWAPTMFIEKNGNNYLELASPDDKEKGVVFSNPSVGNGGGLYYNLGKMSFRTGSNDTRMTIDETGKVGIGTNTPKAKLDINGDFALSGSILLKSPIDDHTFDNVNLNGKSVIIVNRETIDANHYNLAGIAGGEIGKIVQIINMDFFLTLTIKNFASSNSENSIVTGKPYSIFGNDLEIDGDGACTLMYVYPGWWLVIAHNE